MKRRLIYIYTVIFLLSIVFNSSCSKEELEEKKYSDIELNILELVNSYRINKGLNALEMNEVVYAEATNHTNYMIEKDELSHDGSEERFNNLAAELGTYSFAENVAFGYSNEKEVVDGWLQSPGHKKNIEGDYTITGISAKKNSKGVYYYTQIFAKK